MNITLNKLCLTASSLNQVVLYSGLDEYESVLSEQCLSIIRRLYDIKGFSNEATRHGHECEKLLIENKYCDNERFEVQKVCETDLNIGGVVIPIRATLDVYDTLNDEVIEIKSPFFRAVDSSNAQEYANRYNTQIQVQLLCSGAKHAKVVIYWRGKLFECESMYKVGKFVESVQKNVLDFWGKLNTMHESYLSGDKKVLNDLYKYDDSPFSKDSELLEDMRVYKEKTEELAKSEKELLELKKKIVDKVDEIGVEKITNLPFVTISKTKESYRYDYQGLLKKKFNFDPNSLSEEETTLFMKKSGGHWMLRVKA